MSLWRNPFGSRDDSRVASSVVDDRPGLPDPAITPAPTPVGPAGALSAGRARVGWTWPTLDDRPPGRRRSILLVFPVFTEVYPPAFQNFLRLCIVGATYSPFDFHPLVIERQPVHGAMNQAVDVLLQQGFDAMIVFDDDCLPYLHKYEDARRFQVIPRLLGLWEEGRGDIIAGVGYMRGYPHTTTVGRLYPEGFTALPSHELKGFYWIDDPEKHADEMDDQGLLTADFCGMPIMLISRKALVAVTQAEPLKNEQGAIVPNRHLATRPAFATKDESDGGATTHDVYFCKKAREAGLTVRVDTNIDCGHIVQAPIVDRFTRPLARQVRPSGTEAADGRGTAAGARTPDEQSVRVARERVDDPLECGVPV